MAFIVEDFDVGFFGAEEFLGAEEGVAGGEVWVAGGGEEEVGLALGAVAAFEDGGEDARLFEDSIDVSGGAGDDDVATFFAHVLDEIIERHDGGGIKVAGVFHAQDDYF